jgi:transcriptional regulator GlxA family with amidase domain
MRGVGSGGPSGPRPPTQVGSQPRGGLRRRAAHGAAIDLPRNGLGEAVSGMLRVLRRDMVLGERGTIMIQKVVVTAILFTFASFGASATTESKPYTKNVAIVLYEGVEVLDFAGPAEVFESASGYGSNGTQDGFNVFTVSRSRSPLVSQGFLDITPDYSIDDSPKPDILVLPGGNSQSVIDDAAWMEWVKTCGRDAEHVLTVCTGAFIAGKAGLLDGVEATTWYNAIPALTKQFPNTRVQPGRRFIDNGKIITTAGVSAGIDGSLHLVARLLGRYVADRTAEYMEYKWSPESFLSSQYTQLNPQLDDRGRALQQGAISLREHNPEAAIAVYRSLLASNHDDAEAWLNLGRALHGLKRYDEAIAANKEAAKTASQRAKALYNLACEYALTGQRDKAIDAAIKAADAGYRVKWSYANDPDLAAIRDEPRFQALLANL